MTDSKTVTPETSTVAEEWAEANVSDQTKPYWVMPVLILYVGFFLGPFVTLFFTALASRFRVDSRWALFVIGIAGTVLCLTQGVTVLYGSVWERETTYMVRGLINFTCGIACYLVARTNGKARGYYVSRKTLWASLIAAAVVAGLFFALPPKVLFALGR